MSTISISTLSSIHIGSGKTLLYGNDFLKGNATDGKEIIGIVDPKKVLQIIGFDNIQTWVSQIENNVPTDSIIRALRLQADLEEYSQRTILDWIQSIRPSDTLKEFIYDGFRRPYIPGSSIKGAIRTAVLSSLADSIDNKELLIKRKRGDRSIITASAIEQKLFGNDPNSDIFRFLQVGDAIFDSSAEMAAIRMVSINERPSAGFWDTSKSQIVEVLLSDCATKCTINLKSETYHNLRSTSDKQMHALPECMQNINSLFRTINHHTSTLLEKEIKYWEDKVDTKPSEYIDKYINSLNDIFSETEKYEKDNGNSCVLRLGYGSGWRFITGAWSETLNNFVEDVIPSSRPGNYKYTNFSFPKSRRVDEECEPLGFVRLQVI